METIFSCGAILSGAAALILGSLISVFNARLTAKHKNDEISRLAAIGFLRTVIGFAFLAAVFLLTRALGTDYILPLAGAALGLTVPAVCMALKTAKDLRKGDDSLG